MDPEAFTACLFKWDPRGVNVQPHPTRVVDMVAQLQPQPPQPPMALSSAPAAAHSTLRPSRELGGLEVLFQAYGVRYYTAVKIAELGFTVNTLINMKDEELDEMMNALSQIFRWELLVGERYGIKAAIRAERRRLEEEEDSRRRHFLSADTTHDALSQEGLSEEPVQREKESGGGTWEGERKTQRRKKSQKKKKKKKGEEEEVMDVEDRDEEINDGVEDDDDDDDVNIGGGQMMERQREHPFIVTEPGEVARGKKNGLDYLFHLYEQCRNFLVQVQNIAKERGEKCPTKVTNQVFRYAKKAGANYINKPKMRHYVHCYALHCLDEETSNALRKVYKERGENVGAWRQACYKPLVAIAARQGWDIDAIFNAHPKLACWYVPTKLRQLCHAERNSVAAAASSSASGGGCGDHIPF